MLYWLLIGAFPTKKTFECLKKPVKGETRHWCIFWILFTGLRVLDPILSYIPFSNFFTTMLLLGNYNQYLSELTLKGSVGLYRFTRLKIKNHDFTTQLVSKGTKFYKNNSRILNKANGIYESIYSVLSSFNDGISNLTAQTFFQNLQNVKQLSDDFSGNFSDITADLNDIGIDNDNDDVVDVVKVANVADVVDLDLETFDDSPPSKTRKTRKAKNTKRTSSKDEILSETTIINPINSSPINPINPVIVLKSSLESDINTKKTQQITPSSAFNTITSYISSTLPALPTLPTLPTSYMGRSKDIIKDKGILLDDGFDLFD